MSRLTMPLARKQNLQIQTVADETLVYDMTTDKAYVLSASAAAVWHACNGERTVQEIAQYLSRETPTDETVVWYALAQLNPLLQEPVAAPHEFGSLSRRQFLTRAGLIAGAAAVPVVVSIVAPKAAHAQSITEVCCDCNNLTGDVLANCSLCNTFCADKGGVQECIECI